MAVTAEQVYKLALGLIDEVTETGSFIPDNPDYYNNKSLAFLTIIQAELLPVSQIPETVESMAQTLQLDDRLCLMALPYGLAAHLIMSEDQSLASFLNSRFDELKRKQKSVITQIKDVYGFTNAEKTETQVTADGGSFLYGNGVSWDGGEF
jgi:hypothetical protein